MTEEVVETDRVTMIWPKTLKDAVREKVGPRGLTEFVTEAVDLHLKGGAGDTLAAKERELNEVKHLVQLLADRMVMGGSTGDRLEALMEVEFPSWIDTSGWPSEFAKRVPVEPLVKFTSEGGRTVPMDESDDRGRLGLGLPTRPEYEVRLGDDLEKVKFDMEMGPEVTLDEPDPQPEVETPVEQPVEPEVKVDGKPEPAVVEEEWKPKEDSTTKDDLFARIQAATGQDPATMNLKLGSEIEKPEPKPQLDLCPVCHEELVAGECWTCG